MMQHQLSHEEKVDTSSWWYCRNISSMNINFASILQERFMTCTLKELYLLFTTFTILGLNKITGFTTGNSNTEDDTNLQWLSKYIILSMASDSKVKKTCMHNLYLYKAMCVMLCAMFFYSGPLHIATIATCNKSWQDSNHKSV